MQAIELMSTNLVVVPPETPITAVAELLAARGISAVPVVDDQGKPLGVVTEGDLIRRLAEEPRGPLTWFLDVFRGPTPQVQRFAKAHGKTARDVMTKDLVTVPETATAEEIARLMEQHGIRRVPVVKDGKMVGLVSRADLLRAVLRPQTSAPAPEDDKGILRAVTAALREQPWTDACFIYPEVKDGTVTLHGYARSDVMRQGLSVLVGEVPGVKAVEDRMAGDAFDPTRPTLIFSLGKRTAPSDDSPVPRAAPRHCWRLSAFGFSAQPNPSSPLGKAPNRPSFNVRDGMS